MRLLAPMPSKPKLVIAAIAASAYVKLAVKAGYDVVVIDVFADEDTQNLTTDWHQISLTHQSLDSKQLLQVLDNLDTADCEGFCYGAGFEQQPALLNDIAKRLPVLGNTSQCLENIKNPRHFFGVCDALSIPYPKVCFETDMPFKQGILKEIGGSGGAHIQHATQATNFLQQTHYLQEIKEGLPVSCLFLAHTHGVEVIGFNQQWTSPVDNAPYRFGGLVSHVVISDACQTAITHYVSQLSQAYGLVGLNSCDVICNGDDVWVLEINPRLSASVAMYEMHGMPLIEAHINASRHVKMNAYNIDWRADGCSRACQIVYATRAMQVPLDEDWPDWVADIPKSKTCLHEGAPVLTVHAEAENAVHAKALLARRVLQINEKLTKW